MSDKTYQPIDKESILTILAEYKALIIHQLTVVDFLNSFNSSEELSKHFVENAPNEDIVNITVAKSIIETRKKKNGFKLITDLIDIPNFGTEEFNHLIDTYVNSYFPFPSKLGEDFDRLLMALSRLELFARYKGITGDNFIGLLYALYQKEEGADYDWSEQFKGKTPEIKSEWYKNASFNEDVKVLNSSRSITIGQYETNFQHLITTLLGLISKQDITALVLENKLGEVTSKFLTQQKVISKSSKLNTNVETFLFESMSQSHYHGMADAIAMAYDSSNSFIWNLLNYYTKEKAINKFEITANTIGLGNWNSSTKKFYKDNSALRLQLGNNVEKSAIKYEGQVIAKSTNMTSTNAQISEVAIKSVDSYIDMLSALTQSEEEESNLLSWNRLEARPRTDDFTRTMFAEIRDPLWMLARQYQFGEFLGEDSGSAIETRVNIKKSKLNAFAGFNSDTAQPFDDNEPLEMTVEKTAVNIDLMSRLEMCRWWKRKSKTIADLSQFLTDLYSSTQIEIDEESWNIVVEDDGLKAEIESNSEHWSIHQLISKGNYFDGYKLYKYLKEGNSTQDISPNHGADFSAAASSFMTWVENKYLAIYAPENDSWNKNRLEYSFGCSAPNTNKSTEVYKADEYANGHLDWYYFNKDNSKNDKGLIPKNVDESLVTHSLKTMIPVQLQFPGMPLARYWELEDYKINFDKLSIDRSDTATLAFSEFVTLYSNDWLMVPLNLEAGSICNIESIVVKDVFGQYTKVNTANSDSKDWKRWAMFDITDDSSGINNTIIIPPTLVKSQESKPFEEVNLVKDEIANMIWGIETKIPNQLLGFKDGFEASLERARVKEDTNKVQMPDDLDDAVKIAYKLGNTVPENWIPFIPSLANEETREIQFLRGSMPKPKPNGEIGYDRVRPMTSLLRVNLDNETHKRYNIHEEEIPKSGAIVSRNWQRTRWYNGKVCWWAANKKTLGKGQGNSGLKWDVIEDIER